MNNNSDNKNKKNRNNDKKLNNKGVLKLEKTSNSLENEGHLVWKKIMIFSIIFLPYAIYLFLFKTKTSKYIKAIVVIFLSIALFFIYDTVKYPNRVHNELAYKNIQEISISKDIELNNVFHIEKKKNFNYKQREYITYHIYDEDSVYYGIFEIEEYNKKYELKYLYDFMRNKEINLHTNEFKEFKNINPVVFVEIITNNMLSGFKNIQKVEDIKCNDFFENNKYQNIVIDNKEITFEFNLYGVNSFKSKDSSVEYINEENPLTLSEFESVYKVLFRNFKDKYKIVGFDYFNLSPIFNVLVGDTKYAVKYYYGKGASLQSIDDEEIYLNSLKEIYKINDYIEY